MNRSEQPSLGCPCAFIEAEKSLLTVFPKSLLLLRDCPRASLCTTAEADLSLLGPRTHRSERPKMALGKRKFATVRPVGEKTPLRLFPCRSTRHMWRVRTQTMLTSTLHPCLPFQPVGRCGLQADVGSIGPLPMELSRFQFAVRCPIEMGPLLAESAQWTAHAKKK